MLHMSSTTNVPHPLKSITTKLIEKDRCKYVRQGREYRVLIFCDREFVSHTLYLTHFVFWKVTENFTPAIARDPGHELLLEMVYTPLQSLVSRNVT